MTAARDVFHHWWPKRGEPAVATVAPVIPEPPSKDNVISRSLMGSLAAQLAHLDLGSTESPRLTFEQLFGTPTATPVYEPRALSELGRRVSAVERRLSDLEAKFSRLALPSGNVRVHTPPMSDDSIPAEFVVERDVRLDAPSWTKVANLMEQPPEPTDALREVFRDDD
jgi:hypothetical protein